MCFYHFTQKTVCFDDCLFLLSCRSTSKCSSKSLWTEKEAALLHLLISPAGFEVNKRANITHVKFNAF